MDKKEQIRNGAYTMMPKNEEQPNNVNERMLAFIREKGITVAEFERLSQLGNGFVKKQRRKLARRSLPDIAKAFPELNIDWLDKGEGVMLKNMDEEKRAKSIIMVPVINLDVRGGFGTNDVLESEYTQNVIPFTRDIARPGDFFINVYGDSMSPKFLSGSLLLVRKVELWQQYIEYGQPYVIDLNDDRRIVKYVKKSDEKDCFRLESENAKYESTDIPKEIIRNMFRVIATIQRVSI